MQTLKFKKGLMAISQITAIINSLEDDKEYVCEIKQYRKKRSKTQNNYMWELLGELSQEMNIGAEELYQSYIKEVGIFRDIVLDREAVSTITTVWSAYGLGWFTEIVDNVNDKATVRLYYGSSSYNSKQMSVLIDKVVQDCQAVGIETLTPQEISLLEVN